VVINENLTGVCRAFIDKSESRVAGISARRLSGSIAGISAIVRSVWVGVAVRCKR